MEIWESRDLPVLTAIVELSDAGNYHITRAAISGRTGLDDEAVQRSLFALAAEHPPYFGPTDNGSLAGPDIQRVHSPTGHARRTVGTWPSPEAWVDRLIGALERAADDEPDDDRRGKLRSAASLLGGVARDVAIRAASGAITGAM